MAQLLQDGSILMTDGGRVYGDQQVVVADLCELSELLCGPSKPAAGGGGTLSQGGRGARGPQGLAGPAGAIGPQGPEGAGIAGGWTDDGAIVRLTTATDQVVIGAAVPFGDEKVLVVGDLRVSAGQFLGDEGTAAVPTYSFEDDENTGIFSSGSNAIGFSAGGTETFTVTTTGATVSGALVVTSEVGLNERVGDPAPVANRGFLYTKDMAGVTQLFFERDNGTVVQLS